MAKRKKKAPDPPPGVPAWMATFSDLVTLLLTFFVMLMAMASFEDSSDLDTVMESLRQALAERGFGEGLLTSVLGENLSDARRKNTVAKPKDARPREALDADISPTTAKVAPPDDVRLTLDGAAWFASGRHELAPGARTRLKELGVLLSDHDVGIRVEGHTDREGAEEANWRLSALRALSVVEVFEQDAGIASERLEAQGFGAYHPVAVREADQARNRRIEIVLIGDDVQTASALADLQAAGWAE